MKRDILSQIRKNSGFASKARNTLADEYKTFPVIYEYAVAADASSAVEAFTAPFAMRIAFVSVRATATKTNGALQPLKGTDGMCTAITCAADKAVTNWSAGVEVAHVVLAAGDTVNVIATGDVAAEVTGVITFFGIRL